jgi:hypothetical protein
MVGLDGLATGSRENMDKLAKLINTSSTHQSLLDRVEALAGELENEARAHDNQYDTHRPAELNEWDEAMSESKADAATRMRCLVAEAKNGEPK